MKHLLAILSTPNTLNINSDNSIHIGGSNNIKTQSALSISSPSDLQRSVNISSFFQCLGEAYFLDSVNVNKNLNISGELNVTGNVQFNGGFGSPSSLHLNKNSNATSALDVNNFGLLTLSSLNRDFTGPHIATFTNNDDLPLLHICSWTHDDISINMDCHLDGTDFRLSHTTGCQLRKVHNQFVINYLNSTDNVITPSFSLDLLSGTILYTTPSAIFSNTDGATGSVKILASPSSSEASIAFYKSSHVRTDFPNDYWKLTLNTQNDTSDLRFMLGSKLTSMILREDLSVEFPYTGDNAVIIEGGLNVKGWLRCDGLSINSQFTTNTLHITSDTNVDAQGHAAAVVKGGCLIEKSLMVKDQIISTRMLLSAKKPRLVFNSSISSTDGSFAPVINAISDGTRVILSRTMSPMSTNVAIGVEGISSQTSMWCSIPSELEQCAFNWYAGKNTLMTLDGVGNLSLSGNGNAIVFTGLSENHGLRLGGVTIESGVCLHLGSRWCMKSLASHSDFNLIDTVKNIAVLGVSSENGTVTCVSDVNVSGVLYATGMSTLHATIAEGKVRLNKVGMSYLQQNVIIFPTASNDLTFTTGDNEPLDINGNRLAHLPERKSKTHINRNNTGTVNVWNGDALTTTFDSEGIVLRTGAFNIHKGDLCLGLGDATINGVLSATAAKFENLNIKGKDPIWKLSNRRQQHFLYPNRYRVLANL